MPVGPTVPVLALTTTMRDVALFYGLYGGIFLGFVALVQTLRLSARRAVLNNNTEQALVLYDRLWFLFGPAVRKQIKPQIEINLAVVHGAQGNRMRAYDLLDDARRGARGLKTPDLLVQACIILARMHHADGHYDHALRALQEAKGASERDTRHPFLLTILHQIAEVHRATGDVDETERAYHALRRAADARGEVGTTVLALTYLGRYAYADCRWEESEGYLADAVQRARETGCKERSAVLAYVLFGRLALQQGKYELARGYLVEAATMGRNRGEAGLECIALLEQARLLTERGKYQGAIDLLAEAEKIAAHLQDPGRLAMVHQVYGEAYLQREHREAARFHFLQAQGFLGNKPLVHTEILVLTGLALLEAWDGDIELAMEGLMEAERQALVHRCGFELVCVYDAMALVHARAQAGDDAVRCQTMAHEQRQHLGIQAAISTQYRRQYAA
ncbi:MAG TPA: hypothetical protein VEI97_17925 [bacterium]|nr:hypothetical protein [bacterium]